MSLDRDLDRLLAMRGLSRRQFILATGGLSLAGILAACQTSPTASAVNTLNVGVATLDKQSPDPHIAVTAADENASVAWTIAEPLARRDLNGNLVPCLATKWDVSADGLTWTFTLRQGVLMHDGTTFTAADVKTAIDRVKLPSNLNSAEFSVYNALVTQISNVNVIDDSHVAITTKTPYGTMLNDLPTPIPTSYFNKVGDAQFRIQPIQAGAFKFVSQQLNQSMTFLRFDAFWDATRRPNFKNLILQIVPEESARVAGVQSGSLDVAWALGPSSVKQLQGVAGIRVLNSPDSSLSTIFWQDLKPQGGNPNSPLADSRVRQALMYALDRQSIAKAIYSGTASPATNLTLATSENDPLLKPYPYDPNKAKQLLAQAGHTNLSFVFSSDTVDGQIPNVGQLGQAMTSYWTDVGATVDYRPTDEGVLSNLKDAHKITGALMLGIAGSNLYDPSFIPSILLLSTSPDATANDPNVDAIIQKMNASVDPATVAAASVQLSDYVYQNQTISPVLEHSVACAVGPHVSSWQLMSGNGTAGPFWYLRA